MLARHYEISLDYFLRPPVNIISIIFIFHFGQVVSFIISPFHFLLLLLLWFLLAGNIFSIDYAFFSSSDIISHFSWLTFRYFIFVKYFLFSFSFIDEASEMQTLFIISSFHWRRRRGWVISTTRLMCLRCLRKHFISLFLIVAAVMAITSADGQPSFDYASAERDDDFSPSIIYFHVSWLFSITISLRVFIISADDADVAA